MSGFMCRSVFEGKSIKHVVLLGLASPRSRPALDKLVYFTYTVMTSMEPILRVRFCVYINFPSSDGGTRDSLCIEPGLSHDAYFHKTLINGIRAWSGLRKRLDFPSENNTVIFASRGEAEKLAGLYRPHDVWSRQS